jgi:guanylate kinase
MSRAKLLVLAGPTAVGKGTVARYIIENHPEIVLSVSATTRSPRPGEENGVAYYFLTDEEFDGLVQSGQMLEYAVVHGKHRYGTPRGPVEAAINAGHPVLLEIDIQGARQVKAAMPEAVTVFLAPPSWDELVRRLEGRGTETEEDMARRLATAETELASQGEFDHVIVNQEVAVCAEAVVELMKS